MAAISLIAVTTSPLRFFLEDMVSKYTFNNGPGNLSWFQIVKTCFFKRINKFSTLYEAKVATGVLTARVFGCLFCDCRKISTGFQNISQRLLCAFLCLGVVFVKLYFLLGC